MGLVGALVFLTLLGGVEGERAVGHRQPFGLLVVSPGGGLAGVRSSEVARTFAEALEARTWFRVRMVDPQEAMTECGGELPCIARWLERGDAYGNERVLDFALISGVQSAEGPAWLSLTLVDARQLTAAQTIRGVVRAPPILVRDAQAVRRALQTMLQETLRPVLEPRGAWDPYGKIAIQSSVPNASVLVDGRLVGVTVAGRTTLTNVARGEHVISLMQEGHIPWEAKVVVTPGGVVDLDGTLEPESWTPTRTAIFIGGLATAAAGLGLTIYSGVQARDASAFACIAAEGVETEGCAPNGFTTLGRTALTAPLGYSLLAAGAGPAIASGFWEDEWVAWLGLGVGLAVGASAYGISAALSEGGPDGL